MSDQKNFDLMYTVLGVSSREALTRAIAALDGQLVEEPENIQARLARSAALLFRHDYEEADNEAARIVTKHPDSFWGHYIHGLAAWSSEKHSRAQECLESALMLDPDHGDALCRFALFMACERAPRPAAQAVDRALHAVPDSALAWKSKALLLYRTQQFPACVEAIDQSLDCDFNQDDIKLLKAQIFLTGGRLEEARLLAAPLLGSLPWGAEAEDLLKQIDRREKVAEKLEKDDRFRDALLDDAVITSRQRDMLSVLRWCAVGLIALGGLWVLYEIGFGTPKG